jgi:hypothetical protein
MAKHPKNVLPLREGRPLADQRQISKSQFAVPSHVSQVSTVLRTLGFGYRLSPYGQPRKTAADIRE